VSHERDRSDVLLVLRIVHAALAASILFYGGVIVLVTRAIPPENIVPGAPIARTDAPAWTLGLGALLAAALLIAVAIVRRRFRPETYAKRAITSWALTEAIAIVGLVMGMLHRDAAIFVPFGAVSFAVILLLAPRRRLFEGDPAEPR
jgi:hypothetical protein